MKKTLSSSPLLSRLREVSFLYTLLGFAVIFIISSFLSPSFLQVGNLLTILRQASLLVILSMGLTAVVITGNIDLSVASCAALTGCICAKMMTTGHSIAGAILVSLLVGVATGLFNGFLVGVLNLPSFIASYGTRMVLSGLAIIVMNGGVIYGLDERFQFLATGYIGPIPFLILLAVVFVIILGLLYYKTTYGRQLYMYGSNHMAAQYSGMNTLFILISSYVLSGLCASIGGVILAARANAADSTMASPYVLQTVAAVVVGGTSLLGGEGGLIGTVIGSLVLVMITNIMNILMIDANWQNLVIGISILLMVWIDVTTRNRRMKK